MLAPFQMGAIAAASGAGGSGYDVHYSSVVLLMHFSGVNDGTNFTCSATGRAITREGNPVISSAQSVFGGTGGYFDGSGDRLALGGTIADFNLGPTYTIEFAIYPLSMPSAGNWCRFIITGVNSATQTLVIQWDSTGNIGIGIASGGTLGTYSPGGTLTTGSWQRFAFSVNAGAVTIFKNGTQVATGSVTQQANGTSGTPYIGFDTTGTVNFNFHGYVDELRITKGVARYSANYTVADGPFPDRGPTSDDPLFTGVSALLHFEGANASTTMSDEVGAVWTAGGNAQISTAQSRFGGSSLLLDGTDDFISRNASTFLNIQQADFTFEAWVRLSSWPGAAALFNMGDSGSVYWQVLLDPAQGLRLNILGVDLLNQGNTTGIAVGTWMHVAVTREGNTLRGFIDGVQRCTSTNGPLLGPLTTTTFFVGQNNILLGDMHGHIDELRITRACRYTGAFTPATTSFPDAVKPARGVTVSAATSLIAGSATGGSASATTWNPSDKSAGFTLSGGNLIASETSSSEEHVRSIAGKSSGKWYWEISATGSGFFNVAFGIRRSDEAIGTSFGSGQTCVVRSSGNVYSGSSGATIAGTAFSWVAGDVISIAWDADGKKLYFAKNGVWQDGGNPATGTAPMFTGVPTGTWHAYAATDNNSVNHVITANFGGSAFAYTPPSGFSALA